MTGDFLDDETGRDELFIDAAIILVREQTAQSSIIQRRLKLGYNRTGRIMDSLAEAGVLSGEVFEQKLNFESELAMLKHLKCEIIKLGDGSIIIVDKKSRYEAGDLVYDYVEKRVEIATDITVVTAKSNNSPHAKVVATIGPNDFEGIPAIEPGIIDKILSLSEEDKEVKGDIKKEIREFASKRYSGGSKEMRHQHIGFIDGADYMAAKCQAESHNRTKSELIEAVGLLKEYQKSLEIDFSFSKFDKKVTEFITRITGNAN